MTAADAARRTALVVFHPLDPRGSKIGGIETHVRLILAHHPSSVDVVLVGCDEIGDAVIGRAMRLRHAGRDILFLPVLRVEAGVVNRAARRIRQSLTFRYLLAALRHLPAIRRAASAHPASCEIGRFEFAVLPLLLRRPLLVVVHNEGRRGDAMDSLLKRHWWLHRLNEGVALRLAARIVAVNAAIARRIATLSPKLGSRTRVLSVSVDTAVFAATPFPDAGDTLRVCYAGRLDAFKDPALMFAALSLAAAGLRRRPVAGFRRLSFRYAGPSDPALVPGFGAVADILDHRGVLAAPAVAALMRDSHCGLVTSVFEGLPCYLLEMLSSGRPVAAVDLPQFRGLVIDGVSGARVEREAAVASGVAMAQRMADAVRSLAENIAAGAYDPAAIAALAAPFSVARQMGELFAMHQALAASAATRSARTA